MGGNTWGYARRSVWKRAAMAEAQRDAIAGYSAARGRPFLAERQLFVDAPLAYAQAFVDRPAGRVLWGRLRRGDRLVVASLDWIFLKVRDCALILDCLTRLGVALHAVDLGGPVHELSAGAMAEVLAAIERVERSERAAVSAARSKHYGRPVNGSPPYGFEWARRPGTREWELVPDEAERALGRQMLEWYEAGRSIDSIRQHLHYSLKLEFLKQRGRKKRPVRWNNDAVWRRIRGEMRLREREAEGVAGLIGWAEKAALLVMSQASRCAMQRHEGRGGASSGEMARARRMPHVPSAPDAEGGVEATPRGGALAAAIARPGSPTGLACLDMGGMVYAIGGSAGVGHHRPACGLVIVGVSLYI